MISPWQASLGPLSAQYGAAGTRRHNLTIMAFPCGKPLAILVSDRTTGISVTARLWLQPLSVV
jgi:hypothetical protein